MGDLNGVSAASSAKITRALARRLAQSQGKPVDGVVFAAVDTEKLTLSSFAARAAARNQEVMAKLSALLARIRAWEASSGQKAAVAVQPEAAAVKLTAPAELFSLLAEDDAAAALDVDTG